MHLPALDCWFLTGQTASGKTCVGIELAERLNAEIISLDSMTIYQHMDIGTAKPTMEERQRVPHHLIDLIPPHDDFSLAQYVAAANERVAEIQARGREVLFVGGTPLYLKALLRGIFEGPSADQQLRRNLADYALELGPGALHARLQAVDPVSAARLHPNDTRRLIRAVEVFELTGRPISAWQQQFEIGRTAEAARVFVLEWPRPEINLRIDSRVDAMFAAGLVDETRGLMTAPRPLSRTAQQALGYREVIEHLAGMRDLPATIDLVKLRTRQFAKRQATWFRSLSECRMLSVSNTADLAAAAERIVGLGSSVAT